MKDSDLLTGFAEEHTVNGVTFVGEDVLYVDETELDSMVGMGWMSQESAIDLLLAHKTKREHSRDLIAARRERYLEWLAEFADEQHSLELERPSLWH